MAIDTTVARKIVYPTSDGQPMADNTKQFRLITMIQGNLAALYRNDPNVFVAGDLLWYPVEGEPTIRRAPDTMVVFGRPKGDRGAYLQWREDNIPPQIVFEILSPGNTITEMSRKLRFYDRYGVEEYYIYDPDRNDLAGWQREAGALSLIEGINGWTSPRLGIRLTVDDDDLAIYWPDGQAFVDFVELERQRSEERQRANEEYQRSERLAQRLHELGIDPATV